MNDVIHSISATEAAAKIKRGALLIDIREADEFARERIDGAHNRPLNALGIVGADGPVIFHCKTGNRTNMNAECLRQACKSEAYLLDGGIEGWKAKGLPVVADRSKPLEIMRQVQIIAGSLIILTLLLGAFASPAFLLLTALIGTGMLYAGVSGSCAMARLLMPLPWNKRLSA